MIRAVSPVLVLCLSLSACTAPGDDARVTADEAQPFDGIAEDETLYFGGNEPFWGGEVVGETLRYSTPDNIDGTTITVKRFAGMNGLGYSGELDGQSFDMAVTEGDCNDTMSDRSYPFTVTLRLGEEVLSGCGHSDARPFTGPENP